MTLLSVKRHRAPSTATDTTDRGGFRLSRLISIKKSNERIRAHFAFSSASATLDLDGPCEKGLCVRQSFQSARSPNIHRSVSSPSALPLSFSRLFPSTVRHRPEHAQRLVVDPAPPRNTPTPSLPSSSSVRSDHPSLSPSPSKHPEQVIGLIRHDTETESSVPEYLRGSVALVEKIAATKVFFETQYTNSEFRAVPARRAIRLHNLKLHLLASGLTFDQQNQARRQFYHAESEYLRKLRVLKSPNNAEAITKAGYEPLRVLGKGSFGTVRLVREKNRVYAMKTIRKSGMLKSCQEGHLRAERDFLVSCAESSKWVVPLVASFQDMNFLYLVMEYEIGGDFLGYLLREETLPESYAQWYIAEMVLCVEETHRLKWIHRDIKPDNFLISASGHLKISDFGLAFDGHWAHQQAYYTNHRASLMETLGIEVAGDAEDREVARLRAYRNHPARTAVPNQELRFMRRRLARSVVGTSQYMAPEVVRGHWYDGRCDWWSIGIILFECLFGFTPFCRETRDETKAAILRHEQLFYFPGGTEQSKISRYALDLIWCLLKEPGQRLGASHYTSNDFNSGEHQCYIVLKDGGRSSHTRLVNPADSNDIKRHPFFRGIPWRSILQRSPPFMPGCQSEDSTEYFESEGQILKSDSGEDEDNEREPLIVNVHTPKEDQADLRLQLYGVADENISVIATSAAYSVTTSPINHDHFRDLHQTGPFVQNPRVDGEEPAGPSTSVSQKDNGTAIHIPAKHRNQKRPRDKVLRDPATASIVLEARKRGAFLGYEYCRPTTCGLGSEIRAACSQGHQYEYGHELTAMDGDGGVIGSPSVGDQLLQYRAANHNERQDIMPLQMPAYPLPPDHVGAGIIQLDPLALGIGFANEEEIMRFYH